MWQTTDRQTDNAMKKCVGIDGIAWARAIVPENTYSLAGCVWYIARSRPICSDVGVEWISLTEQVDVADAEAGRLAGDQRW